MKLGDMPRAVKLNGFSGAGLLDVVEDYDGKTDRTVYTAHFPGMEYVHQCFWKKSKRGIKMPLDTLAVLRRVQSPRLLRRQ